MSSKKMRTTPTNKKLALSLEKGEKRNWHYRCMRSRDTRTVTSVKTQVIMRLRIGMRITCSQLDLTPENVVQGLI